MAKYSDIVAAQTIGDYGNTGPAGFTRRWDAAATQNFSVIADAASPSGKAIRMIQATAVRGFFSWDGINADPERGTSTQIILIVPNSSISGSNASFGGPATRCTGTGSSETGATAVYARNGGTGLLRASIYTSATNAFTDAAASNVWTQGNPFWIKLAVSGTSYTATAYAENDLNGTPITSVTRACPASNADDWHGLFMFSSETDYTVRYWAVGTGTDQPDPPVGSGADVSFTMPQFSVSASAENVAPNPGAVVSFTMPQFTADVTASNTAPDAITLITDFDASNVSPALSAITDPSGAEPRLFIDFRPAAISGTNGDGWNIAAFAVENAGGKRPVFALNRGAMHQKTLSFSTLYLPSYTQDFITFTQAPSRTLIGGTTGTIEFQFTDPLPAGRVYIVSNPMVQQGEAAPFAAALLANPNVSPLPSANASGVYFTSPAEVDENGRQIGGHDCYALKFEFGGATTDGGPKRKLLTTAGIHAMGEQQSWISFKAFIDYILNSADADAARLRSDFDIYCYFNITPNGIFGGHRRHNIQRATDPNRDFVNKSLAEIAALTTAITSDTGGAVDVSFGWHGYAHTQNNFVVLAPSSANTTRFIELGTEIFGNAPLYEDFNTVGSMPNWVNTNLSSQFSVECEIQGRGDTSLANYQDIGQKWAKTLSAADADGMFVKAASTAFTMPQFSVSISADNAEPAVGASVAFAMPQFTTAVSAESAAPGSGATVSFTMPQFVASVAAENTVPAFAADVAFSMPQFTAAVTGESFISGNLATVSFVMPQFTVSASVDKTVPEITAAAAFTMPQFTVSVFSGEFEYFNAPGTAITYIAESTEITYNP